MMKAKGVPSTGSRQHPREEPRGLLTEAVSLSAGVRVGGQWPSQLVPEWTTGGCTYRHSHVEEATRSPLSRAVPRTVKPTGWPSRLEASPRPGVLVYGLPRARLGAWKRPLSFPRHQESCPTLLLVRGTRLWEDNPTQVLPQAQVTSGCNAGQGPSVRSRTLLRWPLSCPEPHPSVP